MPYPLAIYENRNGEQVEGGVSSFLSRMHDNKKVETHYLRTSGDTGGKGIFLLKEPDGNQYQWNPMYYHSVVQ